MNLEMTPYEAELLIALLMFAEGAAPVLQPELTEALKELRPLRSALLQTYLRERISVTELS